MLSWKSNTTGFKYSIKLLHCYAQLARFLGTQRLTGSIGANRVHFFGMRLILRQSQTFNIFGAIADFDISNF
jgi:hypothetical protein